jgi:hypothetical protein
VELDPEDLRRHYAMLSDEALVALDRSELVELAQQVYDQELRSRRLTPEPSEDEPARDELNDVRGLKPQWLDDAACAAVFASYHGGSSGADAEGARDVLEAAGIPCYIDVQKAERSDGDTKSQSEFRLLVPGKLNLEAVSLLDKEIFNAELEAEYRTHFGQLSDEELHAVKPEVLLAGLSDRIERLTRAYTEEMERRRTA